MIVCSNFQEGGCVKCVGGMIGAIIDLETGREAELYLPMNDGRYCLTDRDWHTRPDKTVLRSGDAGAPGFSCWLLELNLYLR